MQNIIKYIEQCNDICYTSYRTAAKMQILHKELSSKFNIFLFYFIITNNFIIFRQLIIIIIFFSAICSIRINCWNF